MKNNDKEESDSQKHLRIVNEIAAIFEKELPDHDDIYFVIRTLRNIYLWDEEESRTSWLFERALDKFMKRTGNREWFKNHFNLQDKTR